VLLVLGKRRVCEELTVEWYARSHGLTNAETVVIKGLCADLTPQEIAQRQGVGLATIRTQIGSFTGRLYLPDVLANGHGHPLAGADRARRVRGGEGPGSRAGLPGRAEQRRDRR